MSRPKNKIGLPDTADENYGRLLDFTDQMADWEFARPL